MKKRIVTGLILAAVVTAALWFGGFVELVLLALCSFAGTYEVAHAITKRGLRPLVFPVYLFCLSYPFLFHRFGLTAVLIAFFFAIILSITLVVFCKWMDASTGFGTLVLYLYPVSLFLCVFLCYSAFPRGLGITAMTMAMAAPSLSDVFAYFGGTFFGKRKLCPSISPKKTVAGAIAGLLGGTLCGYLLFLLQPLWGSGAPLLMLLCLGLACGFFGQIGDLFASMIKRWVDVKDFSGVFGEHGGFMDRFDSILLCGPVVLTAFYVATKITHTISLY